MIIKKAQLICICISMLITFVLGASSCKSADFIIERNHLLGYQEVSDSIPEMEATVLKETSFLRYLNTGEGFSNNLHIYARAIFKDLPNTKMYYLETIHKTPDTRIDPYLRVLFNSSDSTIYPFGGDTYLFSKVTADYIDRNFNQKEIVELLKLYINTLNPEDPYYLLQSIGDFRAACYDYILASDTATYFNSTKYLSDMKFIENTVKPFKFQPNGEGFQIEFFTWNQSFGDFEYWQLEIAKRYIQILNRHELRDKIGPYNLRYIKE